MKLLTKTILATLPPLGGQGDNADPVAYIKFFTPDSSWTWYATEGEPWGMDHEDFLFYGYVIGAEAEWGEFSLLELQAVRGKLGLPVERDLWFQPTPISRLTASS